MQVRKRHRNRTRTNILIADGEGVFRLGLKKLFSVEDDLRVVAQAEDSSQLLAMVTSFRPDLAVVQQELTLNGHGEILPQILKESPDCKVIVTGSRLNDMENERLFRDGASGVIPRSATPEVFVDGVRRVLSGETLRPPRQEQNEEFANGFASPRTRPVDTLTPREKTIISCLTQGWRNRDIAQHLTITEQTVKNHLRSIYDKVGVSDRLELVLYAIHQNMELPPVNAYS